jgi:uncharacterized OsmC-like protein
MMAPRIGAEQFTARQVLAGAAGEAQLIEIRAASRWVNRVRSDVHVGRHRLVADEPRERGGEDAGPTPLQLVLAGLCACETVTMRRLAPKLRMQVDGFEIDAHAVIDARGRSGDARIPAHFLRVEVLARVRTPEPPERVQRLKELVERHCPVATLLQSAPLEFRSEWEKTEQGI